MEPQIDLGALLAELQAPAPDSPEFIPWLSQTLNLDPRLVATMMRDDPEGVAALLDQMGTPVPAPSTPSLGKSLAESEGAVGVGAPAQILPTPPAPALSVQHPPNPTVGAATPTGDPMLGDTRFTQPATPAATGPTQASKIGALLTAMEGVQAPEAPIGQTIDTPAAPRVDAVQGGGLGALIAAMPGMKLDDNRIRLMQALGRR